MIYLNTSVLLLADEGDGVLERFRAVKQGIAAASVVDISIRIGDGDVTHFAERSNLLLDAPVICAFADSSTLPTLCSIAGSGSSTSSRIFTETVGSRRPVGSNGQPSTARPWFLNCEVRAPSMIQWPELWGRGAISLTRISPSSLSKSSIPETPRPSRESSASRATSWARSCVCSSVRAGETLDRRISS